jgi:hypothetical protein
MEFYSKATQRIQKDLDIIRLSKKLKENSLKLLALMRDPSTRKLSKLLA